MMKLAVAWLLVVVAPPLCLGALCSRFPYAPGGGTSGGGIEDVTPSPDFFDPRNSIDPRVTTIDPEEEDDSPPLPYDPPGITDDDRKFPKIPDCWGRKRRDKKPENNNDDHRYPYYKRSAPALDQLEGTDFKQVPGGKSFRSVGALPLNRPIDLRGERTSAPWFPMAFPKPEYHHNVDVDFDDLTAALDYGKRSVTAKPVGRTFDPIDSGGFGGFEKRSIDSVDGRIQKTPTVIDDGMRFKKRDANGGFRKRALVATPPGMGPGLDGTEFGEVPNDYKDEWYFPPGGRKGRDTVPSRPRRSARFSIAN